MRCQYESRVCRIQISLQGLETRNQSELVNKLLPDQRLFSKQITDVYTTLPSFSRTTVLIFYLCNRRGDGWITVVCL